MYSKSALCIYTKSYFTTKGFAFQPNKNVTFSDKKRDFDETIEEQPSLNFEKSLAKLRVI